MRKCAPTDNTRPPQQAAHEPARVLGGVGRSSRAQDDIVNVKTAGMCVTTALQHLIGARDMSPRDAVELQLQAQDQVQLAVRLLGEVLKRGRSHDRANKQAIYAERKAAKLCPKCGQPAAPGRVLCTKHLGGAARRDENGGGDGG